MSLQRIEAVLRPLASHENDFAASNAIVGRIAMLENAIDEIGLASEPWLVAWLSDEHLKGAVLYAPAKTNWNHEQEGRGALTDRQKRVRIVNRFSTWVEQLIARLSEYEYGSRTASTVTGWRTRLSATFENEAIATGENEATQADWLGDYLGGLGVDPAAGRGWCSASTGGSGVEDRPFDG